MRKLKWLVICFVWFHFQEKPHLAFSWKWVPSPFHDKHWLLDYNDIHSLTSACAFWFVVHFRLFILTRRAPLVFTAGVNSQCGVNPGQGYKDKMLRLTWHFCPYFAGLSWLWIGPPIKKKKEKKLGVAARDWTELERESESLIQRSVAALPRKLKLDHLTQCPQRISWRAGGHAWQGAVNVWLKGNVGLLLCPPPPLPTHTRVCGPPRASFTTGGQQGQDEWAPGGFPPSLANGTGQRRA